MAFRYAVIPSHGTYGSGDRLWTCYRSNSLVAAKKYAARITRRFRENMAHHGGSSGGYRVIEWQRTGRYVGLGHECDRIPSV